MTENESGPVRVFNTGRGWGYAVQGVRPTPKLYLTKARALAAARRALKRLEEQEYLKRLAREGREV